MKNLKINKKNVAILVGGVVLVGSIGIASCTANQANKTSVLTPTPSISVTPTPTVTPTSTPEPIFEKPVIEYYINKINEINSKNKESGLDMNSELTNIAILGANLPQFSVDQLYELGLYKIEEGILPYTLMDYIDSVNNHNETNFPDNYLSLVDLIIDEGKEDKDKDKEADSPLLPLLIGDGSENDKELLQELDYEYVELRKTLIDLNTSDKDKKIAAESTINYIYEFVCGYGKLCVESGNYDRQNLSPGAGLIAEGYFSMICSLVADKGYGTTEIQEKINFIQNDALGINSDGTKSPNGYITGMNLYDTVTKCYEKAQEVNSKTK